MSCDNQWTDDRIASTKSLIEKYEQAIDALSNGTASYSLNTGQTSQTVTKQNITSLMKTLQSLENRLATLQARRSGGSVNVKPAW
jgi:hypothetical protein